MAALRHKNADTLAKEGSFQRGNLDGHPRKIPSKARVASAHLPTLGNSGQSCSGLPDLNKNKTIIYIYKYIRYIVTACRALYKISQKPGFRGRATGSLRADFATAGVSRGSGFQSSPGRDSRSPQTEAHI